MSEPNFEAAGSVAGDSPSDGNDNPVALFAARSIAEATIWAQFDPCRCGGLGVDWQLVSVESLTTEFLETQFVSPCRGCGVFRRVSFSIPAADQPAPFHFARPGDDASVLYDAAEWWAFARRFDDAAGQFINDTPGRGGRDRSSWEAAVGCLTQSAAALDEVLRFLPDAAPALPDTAFRTPWSTNVAASNAEAFTRSALETEHRTRWARVADFVDRHPFAVPSTDEFEFGGPPEFPTVDPAEQPDEEWPVVGDAALYPFARSVDEEQLYLLLHPCECGQAAFDPATGLDTSADGAQLRWYRGLCESCGELRHFVFRETPDMPMPAVHAWAFGEQPSELLDPAQWWSIVEALLAQYAIDTAATDEVGNLAADAPVHAGAEWQGDLYADLCRSAAAIDEISKFIPAGADDVPASAFMSRDGMTTLHSRPDLFGRPGLQARKGYYLRIAAGLEASE